MNNFWRSWKPKLQDQDKYGFKNGLIEDPIHGASYQLFKELAAGDMMQYICIILQLTALSTATMALKLRISW